MLWYNILNPRSWPGVDIKTGNNRIDGIYYNLLSSNHVSLAASGSMFLAANSGIQLISPSFVGASGIKCTRILSENYGKINNTGGIIPLYSGSSDGLMVKLDDNNLFATDIITYNSGLDELRFPSASDGSVLYTVPEYTSQGISIEPTKKISTFNDIALKPASTNLEGQIIESSSITFSTKTFINNGASIGPNNFLDSYKGYILTHDGSGNVAQWKPATYLRENYDKTLQMEGLERIGINWIRYPRRPALILNKRLYIYKLNRPWSAYPAIGDSLDIVKDELGTGSDTLCVTKIKGEAIVGYTKFAFVDKGSAEQTLNTSFDFDLEITSGSVIDPDSENPDEGLLPCWIIDIAPENPNNISDDSPGTNVSLFSVTKGAYLPMQIEPLATETIKLRNDSLNLSGIINKRDDGSILEDPLAIDLRFKPSTINNISIKPNIYTSFNMLGEDIDFLIYGKENTPFNVYDSRFDLNDNFIPNGIVPILKIDATIPNSISGSPTGVVFSKFTDRQKTQPIGWSFDNSGKVCIKTHDAYVLSSVVSGTGSLKAYADVTISGHTYSSSLITEDLYLKPEPVANNTGKYIRNALLTIDSAGKIISRTPRVNPSLPGAPFNINTYFGQNSCSISWSKPQQDGNSKIINYVLQVSLNEGSNWINIPISGSVDILKGFDDQTEVTIKADQVSLINNGIFRVAAQNAIGVGDYSESSETPYVNNLNAPEVPTSFNYERNIDNEFLSDITLDWTIVNGMSWGGVGVVPSGFFLEESSFDGIVFSSFSGIAFIPYQNGENAYSYTETGLNGRDNYLYRLSAVNNNSIKSAYNYVYSTGLIMIDLDLEEEENKRVEELSNFDFGVIMFTGVCTI